MKAHQETTNGFGHRAKSNAGGRVPSGYVQFLRSSDFCYHALCPMDPRAPRRARPRVPQRFTRGGTGSTRALTAGLELELDIEISFLVLTTLKTEAEELSPEEWDTASFRPGSGRDGRALPPLPVPPAARGLGAHQGKGMPFPGVKSLQTSSPLPLSSFP